ncbi:MAG: phosphoadenosine phosphosulfate reductase [Desulfurellales bacterium]|nr:MAG: phosphoadenosine phosphosulfate reductase [Desulfurellales bacterium]
MSGQEFPDAAALCEHIASRYDTVILSFSRGKDSIAAWAHLIRYGLKVVPVHLYLVPGVSFVEDSLRHYEAHFETDIINLPHPSLFRWLRNFTFQAPENLRIIEQMRLRLWDYDQLFAWVRREQGLSGDTPVAVGVTMYDSPNRRASIKRHGPYNRRRQQFYPVFDWDRASVLEACEGPGLPVDYRMFGRSWDGLDYRFLKPIHDHYPADYRRILDIFPLAEIELLRMKWRWSNSN